MEQRATLGWLCEAGDRLTITHARTEADARLRAARRLGVPARSLTCRPASAEDHKLWAQRMREHASGALPVPA